MNTEEEREEWHVAEIRGGHFQDCTISDSTIRTESHTHLYLMLEQQTPQSKADLQEAAILLCRKQQMENIKRDKQLISMQDISNLPIVHPQLVEKNIYERDYRSPILIEKQKFDLLHRANTGNIIFEELERYSKFLALVGGPGSGKTTLSVRLIKFFEDRSRFVCLLKCREMQYHTDITYKELLIDHPYCNVPEAMKEHAFQWILENQHKCVFVLDGYDQATWSLKKLGPCNADYKSKLPVEKLVANLCCKKCFPDSLLIFTSRPYPMLKIPSTLRPTTTVYVDDLAKDDMKQLFFAIAKEQAEGLWQMLSTHAPQVFDLCCNPLLLQFIIFTGLDQRMLSKPTITKVFQSVLDQLWHSKHAKAIKEMDDYEILLGNIAKLAFVGMCRKTVVFNAGNLQEVQLDAALVQDVVISMSNVAFTTHRLMNQDQWFYFVHQMLQEIFTAKHVIKSLTYDEFCKVIPKVMFEEHWSVVRRFLCGLLLGPTVESTPTHEQTAHQSSVPESECKKDKFLECLMHRLQQYESRGIGQKGRGLLELLVDLQECSEVVVETCASVIPSEMDFSDTHITTGAAYALGQVLPRLPHDVKVLNFTRCGLHPDSLRWICQGIAKMKHKVQKLILSGNPINGESTKHLTACLDKLEKLIMNTCNMTFVEMEILANGLQKLPHTLKKLDLSWNRIGVVGIRHLAKILSQIGSLILGNCGLTADGTEILTGSLKQLVKPIKMMDISENKTGDIGAIHMASNLDRMEKLVMQDCDITSVGAEDLANQLKHYSLPIKVLNLSYNDIGYTGARCLVKSLDRIETLILWKHNLTHGQLEVLHNEMRFLSVPESKIEWK